MCCQALFHNLDLQVVAVTGLLVYLESPPVREKLNNYTYAMSQSLDTTSSRPKFSHNNTIKVRIRVAKTDHNSKPNHDEDGLEQASCTIISAPEGVLPRVLHHGLA